MCHGCPYFDGFGCTRSPIVTEGEEKCICDADEVDEDGGEEWRGLMKI